MTPPPEDPMSPAEPTGQTGAAPAPLTVAASLVGVEALLLLLQGVAELFAVTGERVVMGVTTSLFFLVYGAGLAFCGVSLWRLKSWSRAPVVVAQLLQLLLAWSFVGGSTTWVALGLGVVALLALAGVLHPASTAALAEDE